MANFQASRQVTILKDLFESGNMKFESLAIDLQLQLFFFSHSIAYHLFGFSFTSFSLFGR